MITVDDALTRVAGAVAPLDNERVPTTDSLGRVLAEPVCTDHALPVFDQSAVDGYAVRHDDIAAAPVLLPLGAMIAAAAQNDVPLIAPGIAARIFTGGMLPTGADTVVRQELTRAADQSVEILSPVSRGADVRRAGEELPAGAQIASAGATITPGLLGALAFVGRAEVMVRRLPRIRVLVTGDEVVALGATLRHGEVHDANGPLVAAHLQQWGTPVESTANVVDTADAVQEALEGAFDSCDLVLTTGGVSVGDFDFIPSVAEALGAERLLWKVAQKPGMPLYVARRGNCLLIGLPGNPGAVLVNLHVYVRHVLDVMLGRDPAQRWHRAAAPDGVRRETNKTFWLRATASVDAHGVTMLRTLSGQASHMLANLADANALVRIPGEHEGPLGRDVDWTRLSG